jgi:Tfp pilus assembly protein PilZ
VEPALKFARRPRELRKPFVATIVITDVVSERQISAHTSNLSLHGCFVPTPTPLNLGEKVQVTIVYAGAKVAASGRVASARADGMGIAFTKIEQHDQAVLEGWLSDL